MQRRNTNGQSGTRRWMKVPYCYSDFIWTISASCRSSSGKSLSSQPHTGFSGWWWSSSACSTFLSSGWDPSPVRVTRFLIMSTDTVFSSYAKPERKHIWKDWAISMCVTLYCFDHSYVLRTFELMESLSPQNCKMGNVGIVIFLMWYSSVSDRNMLMWYELYRRLRECTLKARHLVRIGKASPGKPI